MKAYGVRRKDFGCCPGHDKFPKETYKNRKSIRAQTRDTRIAHKAARARSKIELRKLLDEEEKSMEETILEAVLKGLQRQAEKLKEERLQKEGKDFL